MVPIAELRENPANFRRHPARQGGALSQVLDEVGLVQGCVLNRRSEALGWPAGEVPTLVDGHLRVELARKRKEASLPVTVVDLSPDEERLVLATLDPLGALAETDVEALAGLIGELPDFTADLGALLAELATGGKKDKPKPPPAVPAAKTPEDLALSDEERAVLAGRDIIVEFSGGIDSTAAAVWCRDNLPDAKMTLLYVDLGSDHTSMPLHLRLAAEALGSELVVARSERTLLEEFAARGEWPQFGHPYCHEFLHDVMDGYMGKFAPETVAVVRGGRLSEKAARTKGMDTRFRTVERMKDYIYFEPLYFAAKEVGRVMVEGSGVPIWPGYSEGLKRTACRICPGQRRATYATLRAKHPDVWAELKWLEGRFGPGCWQDPEGHGHGFLDEMADRGDVLNAKDADPGSSKK